MKYSHLFLFLFLILFSCRSVDENEGTLFTRLSSGETNIDFINKLTETEEFNIIEYLYFNNGAGVAAGDVNNDGLTDLYFTSNQNPNRLFLNKGNLKFEDITKAAGVEGSGDWKTGVTMADINGDGLLDIYVCQVGEYKSINGRNQLFINKGDLTFSEEAHDYGLDFKGFSTQAAFFDYDIDGDLDMYLLNHSVHTKRSYGLSTLRFEKDSLAGDRLFRNDETDGRRVFIDVTNDAGIYSSQIGYGLGVNISDINNDGFPDIFVSNDFHENDYLYLNNGDGTFSEKMTESFGHTSRSSMGNDIGDINNDGLQDIIVLDMLPYKEKIRKQSGGEDDYELFNIKLELGYYYQFVRNTLQLNLGGGLFSETGRLSGVYSTDWSWSPLFCDVDNDGWKDLFITNGIYRRANDLDYINFLTGGNRFSPVKDNSKLSDRDLYEKMPLHPDASFIFKNNGDLTFSDMRASWGFNEPAYSNGSAYADLDNDGDLDLIANNINSPASILRNNSDKLPENHFLTVTFKGQGLNSRGIGSRVTVYNNGQSQLAEQFPTRGFLSASTDQLHFGLGKSDLVDSIIVRWPDMSEETVKNVTVNKLMTFEYKNARQALKTVESSEDPKLFSAIKIPGLEFIHKEDKYVDFNREKLIPHSLSAEGPALAVGDVNGDKLDDVFTGGAKGQASKLFLQQKNGGFRELPVPQFLSDNSTENVDAAFFDADGDSDQDLYVVRGGNEQMVGNPLLEDLLLLNDGNGAFSQCDRGALPYTAYNGSCVSPCDFDNDGDIDLFVGSRSVPGAYGWAPDQLLLENDGKGRFTDATDARMIGLKNIGMVTDAIWIDYDKDGSMDLILAGEWMKITVLRNNRGIFTDVTAQAGLDETSGWWNCLEASDIDLDGDQDLIGGNLGLNSVLKASVKEPVEMYLNDFDNNGTLDQVICSYEDGISYPFASLDELAGKIDGIKKRFPDYSDFGGKTAAEILGEEAISKSLVKKAVLFESCIFINNGDGTFKTEKLPVQSQFSPVRDVVVSDFDSDGINDMVTIGNEYFASPSIGRYDASYGWFLKGQKNGNFIALTPVNSGLEIKGDARKVRAFRSGGKQFLVSAVNNGKLHIFRLL